MFNADSGILAMSFNENGINTSGSLTKSLRRPPEMSFARERAQNTIVDMAKKNGTSVGSIISKILSQSIPELQSFVQARGETPATDVRKLALQAALLRATEIGMAAKMLDTDDTDALYKLEESEQQHVEDNDTVTSSILPADVSASLSLMIDRISSRHKKNGGTGELKDFVSDTRKASGVSNFDDINCGGVVNNATGDDYLAEFEDNYGQVSDSGSWWDRLFGNIDKVVDGVTKASGAINTTIGNVKSTTGGILDQVTNVGGAIGSASISQYLSANWYKWLIAVVVLILFTILIVRATRKQ